MKATGIIRRVDDLGRVVIPKEIRRSLHIKENDPLELYVENDTIIFKKYRILKEENLKILFEALKRNCKGGVAVYDTGYRLFNVPKHNSLESYPSIVPSDWDFYRNTFSYEDDSVVYPLCIEGERVGFVAVEFFGGDYSEFVKGAIETILVMMEE